MAGQTTQNRQGLSGSLPSDPSPPLPCRESSVPVDVARQRELKWLEMFNSWDKWLLRRFQKVCEGRGWSWAVHGVRGV